jgi:hypothetical protein
MIHLLDQKGITGGTKPKPLEPVFQSEALGLREALIPAVITHLMFSAHHEKGSRRVVELIADDAVGVLE